MSDRQAQAAPTPQQREQPARGVAARLGETVPREGLRRHHHPRHLERGGHAFGQPVLSLQDQAGHSGRRDGARPRRRPAQDRRGDGAVVAARRRSSYASSARSSAPSWRTAAISFRCCCYDWRSLTAANRRRIVALKDRYDALWQQVIDDLQRAGHMPGDAQLVRLLILGAVNWTGTLVSPRRPALARRGRRGRRAAVPARTAMKPATRASRACPSSTAGSSSLIAFITMGDRRQCAHRVLAAGSADHRRISAGTAASSPARSRSAFFVSAFVGPFVGRLMDIKGPRVVVEIGVVFLVLGLGPWRARARAVAFLPDARPAGRPRRQFPWLRRPLAVSAELVRATARPCDRHRVLRRRARIDHPAAVDADRDRARWLALGLPVVALHHRGGALPAQSAAAQTPAGHRPAARTARPRPARRDT